MINGYKLCSFQRQDVRRNIQPHRYSEIEIKETNDINDIEWRDKNEIPNFNEIVIELTLRKVCINRAIAVTYRKQLEEKSNYLPLIHKFGYQHYW